ncbi:hypothetical protein ACOSQ2_029065 [Xanthoceras sorbifolium]
MVEQPLLIHPSSTCHLQMSIESNEQSTNLLVCAMGVLIMEAEEIAKICEKLSLSDDDSPVVKVGAIVQKQGKRWTRWNDPEMMHEEKGVKNWDSVYRDPSPRPQIAMSCSRRKMAFLGSELRDLVTATTNRADWLEMKK